MLVIGHRGARGLAPENTMEGLKKGVEMDADILEFDVRITADDQPILCHDSRLYGRTIRQTTLAELEALGPVTQLKPILDEFFGKVLLNLEYKPKDKVDIVYNLLSNEYIKSPTDWDNMYISSFQVKPLVRLRKLNNDIKLALLHSINPFAFVTLGRRIDLTAVGWHRLHVNNLAIAIAKKAGIFTYVYTVNRPKAAALLEQKGIDGIVTDFPDRIVKDI